MNSAVASLGLFAASQLPASAVRRRRRGDLTMKQVSRKH